MLRDNYSTVQYKSVLVFLWLSCTTKPDVFLETAIGVGIGAGGGGGSVCLSAMSISLLMALLFVHFIAIF